MSVKTFNIPEHVPVAGQMYRICIKPELSTDDNDEACWGTCNRNTRTISLVEEFPDGESMLTAYFHEVLHAICEEYGVADMTDKDTDRIAQGITQAFVAFMEAQ